MEQILNDLQKRTLAFVGQEEILSSFYLSGGTALTAYYLRHRISDDLDFFTQQEIDRLSLHNFIEKLKNLLAAKNVRFERLFDRNLFFFQFDNQELKIEFTKYPFNQINEPLVENGLKIDSLNDIAANKLMALLDRFDPKDFVDLFFIMKNRPLNKIRKDAENKFSTAIDDIFLGGEFMKVKRIEALPRMIKAITIDELKEFFISQAKNFSANIF